MKVVLFMAMSVNGYIARENGDEDFLSHANWEAFCNVARECGCFIIGRKTFEAVQQWKEGYNFDSLKGIVKVIVSRNENFQATLDYIIADSPEAAISKLKDKGLKQVLVTGGAKINSAFMKSKLIDEIILNIEPFVLGRGLALFAKDEFESKLELLDVKKIKEGIIQLSYKVIK